MKKTKFFCLCIALLLCMATAFSACAITKPVDSTVIPYDCTKNGHKIENGVCSECGATQEIEYDCTASGHKYVNDVCSECGAKKPYDCETNGHKFADGFCSECGEKQPDVPVHTCADKCVICGKCKTDCTNDACIEKCQCVICKVHTDADKNLVCETCGKTLPLVEHTSWTIMSELGSQYTTTVHQYVSEVEGPTMVIVGGIHGDELAGWNAGLKLVDQLETVDGICGTVILIPQASILADTLNKRYPGQGNSGKYNNVTYTDLNRAFDGSKAGTITGKIAQALIDEIEQFNPNYVIDLHESRASYGDGEKYVLGDSIIYSNGRTGIFSEGLLENYNNNYRRPGEVKFTFYGTFETGTFNQYFSEKYSRAIVFTIETNRDIKGLHGNQSNLDVRVRQQLDLLQATFDLAWNR